MGMVYSIHDLRFSYFYNYKQHCTSCYGNYAQIRNAIHEHNSKQVSHFRLTKDETYITKEWPVPCLISMI